MVLLSCHKLACHVVPRRAVFQGFKKCQFISLSLRSRFTTVTYTTPRVPEPPCRISGTQINRYLRTSTSCFEVVQFHLSDIGEGIKEVTVKEWFVKPGDRIQQFDQICEVQSDKASVTITSRYDGIVKKLHFEVDQVAQTGDALVEIEIAGAGGDGGAAASATELEVQETEAINVGQTEDETTSSKRNVRVLATPAVRRMCAEYNIDINSIMGTGKEGRVLKEDIVAYMETVAQAKKVSAPAQQPVRPPPVQPVSHAPKEIARPVIISGEDKTEPIKGIMKAMTKIMTESLTVPHFGYCDEYDIGKLVDLRSELKKSVEKRSGGAVKLSYMPFFIKACSLALTQYPVINSHFDAKKETITYKANHNIGVAMDTAQGLLVPVVKQVQTLSVYEIAVELNRLQELGTKGKLSEADLSGATFSLSNIGSIGGTYAKPVIVPPQVAIGAIGRVQVLPRFAKDGSVVKAHITNISWSADHRILDGATVARFSNLMKSYLETPASMTLDLH